MFCSRIEVILSIVECCFDEIVEYMFQHVLFMQFCKSDDDDVISIDLANMIELRSVISSVAQLVKLSKWHQIDSKILIKNNISKSHQFFTNWILNLIIWTLNLNIDITVALYRNFMIADSEKITELSRLKVEKSDYFIENMNCWIQIKNNKIF